MGEPMPPIAERDPAGAMAHALPSAQVGFSRHSSDDRYILPVGPQQALVLAMGTT